MLEWLTEIITNKDPYPKTVEEVLDDNIKFKKAVLDALYEFKKTSPFRGTEGEKWKKFQNINVTLSKIYNIQMPILIFAPDRPSCYIPFVNAIFMGREKSGKYSVVTFLHEFGHALGKNEVQTCTWSINLFKKVFPELYVKLVPKGHLLYKK